VSLRQQAAGPCGEGSQQEGQTAQEEEAMKDKDKERKAQILSLWSQRPDGKRTENDVPLFYGEMERVFPHLLDRKRGGDPYQNLHRDLKGHIEERRKRSE
jgi:hypothetical protein